MITLASMGSVAPLTPAMPANIQVTLALANMILMFLSTELMFQAAALAFVAFGRMWMDLSGQLMVIFILTVAAAEAALALGLVVLLYRRKETLSSEAWAELKE